MKYVAKLFLVGIGLLWMPTGASGQNVSRVAEGARAWAENCTRCHNARSPLERNDSDWAIIIGHMRARANLTKTQARDVAIYLQTINRPEGTPIVVAQVAQPTARESGDQKNEETKKGSGGS